MNDLNTIQRVNAEAVKAAVPQLQAAGLYVVQEYAGLNYVNAYSFTTEVEANAYACELGSKPGCRATVLPPTI